MGKLYVGNLPFSSTDEDLKAHFEQAGPVDSAKVIKDFSADKDKGRSRGFGFVEMESSDEAMDQLQGSDLGGRNIKIDLAREKERREPRGGKEKNYQGR